MNKIYTENQHYWWTLFSVWLYGVAVHRNGSKASVYLLQSLTHMSKYLTNYYLFGFVIFWNYF